MRRALGFDFAGIEKDVAAGTACAFEVLGHGYVVLRVDVDDAGGRTLVFIAGAVFDEADAQRHADAVVPAVVAIAERNDCEYVRAHSGRYGMGRLLARYGFEYVEAIYGLEIKKQ